jgi:hypothetical protein
VTRVLSYAEGAIVVNEPDNEWPKPYALKAKLPLGRFPVLGTEDPAPKEFEILWERAFAGFRQGRVFWYLARALFNDRTDPDLWRALCDHANPSVSARMRLMSALARPPRKGPKADTVIVKTVYGPLAVEWIAARMQPDVLIVQRHPFNVVASWVENTWGGCALEAHPEVRERFGRRFGLPELAPDASPLGRVAWEVGLFTSVLEAAADEHPQWHGAGHEDLCVDPHQKFRQLYERLSLTWTEAADRFLDEANRPGTGYIINRIAAEQPERWRRRLSTEQLEEVWSVLSRFDAPWVSRVAADIR